MQGEQVQRGDLGAERLRLREHDLGADVGVDDRVALPRDRRALRVADRNRDRCPRGRTSRQYKRDILAEYDRLTRQDRVPYSAGKALYLLGQCVARPTRQGSVGGLGAAEKDAARLRKETMRLSGELDTAR